MLKRIKCNQEKRFLHFPALWLCLVLTKERKSEKVCKRERGGGVCWDGLVLSYRVEEEYQEVRRGHTGRKMNFMSKQMAALPLDDKAPEALEPLLLKRDSDSS